MKILSAAQVRQADAYTIAHEPVASVDLMERAAAACLRWIEKNILENYSFKIFCGPGNNGGDGLALARMLFQAGYDTEVFLVAGKGKNTEDFLINRKQWESLIGKRVKEIGFAADLPEISKNDCVVEALFGTGLTRKPEGIFGEVIDCINRSGARVIAIDMPGGLFADRHTPKGSIVCAHDTLSFQVPKLAFFFPENSAFVGAWHILDIGLHQNFIAGIKTPFHYLTGPVVRTYLKPRGKFSHKGTHGHALLVAGSYGKMGAAVMAGQACLRSGAGLLTIHAPAGGIHILQTTCYEAMVSADADDRMVTGGVDMKNRSAVGAGPGIGTSKETQRMLRDLLKGCKVPVVLDADALNILSLNPDMLSSLPESVILTPHRGEFERLAGASVDDFALLEKQREFSAKHTAVVILKGAHTCITFPDGEVWFNSTGNAGMAKGGNGDVLTGILLSLMAQGYSTKEASLLGVFIHGLAGDFSAAKLGMDGMIARDLIVEIPQAFKAIRG